MENSAKYAANVQFTGTKMERDERKVRVFGKSAALVFEAQYTSAGTRAIGVDGALKTSGPEYAWANKIIVQLGTKELPKFCALLCGYVERAEFRFHGAHNDKSVEFALQRTGVFAKLSQASREVVAVPIGFDDLYFVRALALQLLAEETRSTIADVIAMLESQIRCHERMRKEVQK